MNKTTSPLVCEMIAYETDCARRVNHFLKVYAFAKAIGEAQGLDEKTQFILESAALVHDCGIRPSLTKYNSSAGTYQQIEGPAVAREILERLNYCEVEIDRICYLVAHHHTYTGISGDDYQILIEADFLVNIYEDEMELRSILSIRDKYFKTDAGKKILDDLYIQGR